jgi:hypothetical protein
MHTMNRRMRHLTVAATLLAATAALAETSTTVVPSTTTTTTTLPDCGAAAATLSSVTCRLDSLILLVGDGPSVGRSKGQIDRLLARVRKNLTEASTAPTSKKARSAVQRAGSALKSFSVRVRSQASRKTMDKDLRTALQNLAGPLASDLKTLERSL